MRFRPIFLSSILYPLSSILGAPALAQQQQPLYEITMEQIHTWRPEGQEKGLYVNVRFKIVRPDGTLAEDVNPEEIVVEEEGRRISALKIQAPSALETLTTVLAIDISGSMAEHGKIDEAKPHFKTYLQLEPDAKDAATIRSFLQGG